MVTALTLKRLTDHFEEGEKWKEKGIIKSKKRKRNI